MIIECKKCHTRFHVLDEQVGDGELKVQCSNCEEKFFITKADNVEASNFQASSSVHELPTSIYQVPPELQAELAKGAILDESDVESLELIDDAIEIAEEEVTAIGNPALAHDAVTKVGSAPGEEPELLDLDLDALYEDDSGKTLLNDQPFPTASANDDLTRTKKINLADLAKVEQEIAASASADTAVGKVNPFALDDESSPSEPDIYGTMPELDDRAISADPQEPQYAPIEAFAPVAEKPEVIERPTVAAVYKNPKGSLFLGLLLVFTFSIVLTAVAFIAIVLRQEGQLHLSQLSPDKIVNVLIEGQIPEKESGINGIVISELIGEPYRVRDKKELLLIKGKIAIKEFKGELKRIKAIVKVLDDKGKQVFTSQVPLGHWYDAATLDDVLAHNSFDTLSQTDNQSNLARFMVLVDPQHSNSLLPYLRKGEYSLAVTLLDD